MSQTPLNFRCLGKSEQKASQKRAKGEQKASRVFYWFTRQNIRHFNQLGLLILALNKKARRGFFSFTRQNAFSSRLLAFFDRFSAEYFFQKHVFLCTFVPFLSSVYRTPTLNWENTLTCAHRNGEVQVQDAGTICVPVYLFRYTKHFLYQFQSVLVYPRNNPWTQNGTHHGTHFSLVPQLVKPRVPELIKNPVSLLERTLFCSL